MTQESTYISQNYVFDRFLGNDLTPIFKIFIAITIITLIITFVIWIINKAYLIKLETNIQKQKEEIENNFKILQYSKKPKIQYLNIVLTLTIFIFVFVILLFLFLTFLAATLSGTLGVDNFYIK